MVVYDPSKYEVDDQPSNHAEESHVPRIQRCFLAWLEANARRFIAFPLVKCRAEQMIKFSLVGSLPTVTTRLTGDQLLAVADDTVLACFDISRKNTGCIFRLIFPNCVRVYTSDDAMWTHYFERLLVWANRQPERPVGLPPGPHGE